MSYGRQFFHHLSITNALFYGEKVNLNTVTTPANLFWYHDDISQETCNIQRLPNTPSWRFFSKMFRWKMFS